MSDNPLSAETVRAFVDKRLKGAKAVQRLGMLALHFIVFVFFVFGTMPFAGADIALIFGWVLGLLIHAAAVWLESDAGERMLRRQLAERAVREVFIQAATDPVREAEKPKREQLLTLSDDGELVPVDDEANDDAAQRTTRAQGAGQR